MTSHQVNAALGLCGGAAVVCAQLSADRFTVQMFPLLFYDADVSKGLLFGSVTNRR
jgi:hypothetical protein